MEWSAEQKAELARQYARIGFVQGERWEAPPSGLTPDQLLDLMRSIPDGAGRSGWQAALRSLPPMCGPEDVHAG